MYALAGGLWVGWALGANDAANVFGTAVGSRIITYRKACIVCSLALILGAVLQGAGGVGTISKLADGPSISRIVIITCSAAATVTIMTIMSLPTSTSQSLVGAIVGTGLCCGNVDLWVLGKVVICWVCTPIGAMLIAAVVYFLMSQFFKRIAMSILTRDKLLWSGLLVVGAYGSYALGANSVANATGVYKGVFKGLSEQHLILLGAIAMSVGVCTYGKKVMMAVGSGVMHLDAFTAFVSVLAMSMTVHVFVIIKVPVSTSQAIVGSIMGIGLVRGVHAIKFRSLRRIGFGWLLAPVVALILSAAAYGISRPWLE